MATENPNLPAPEEQVSKVAEDVQHDAPVETAQTVAAAAPASAEPAPAAVAEAPARAAQGEGVDFTDEEAALAAEQADLSLGEEPAAEEEGEADAEALQAAASDRFVGKSKQELLELFARMLEEQPVQTLRRDVEALKVAFYKLRRAEVEAARRAFVEPAARRRSSPRRWTAPRRA